MFGNFLPSLLHITFIFMKPIFVSTCRPHVLIQDLARNAVGPQSTLMLYLGSRSQFLAELPSDWYSNLGPEMTEEFTDSFEIEFLSSVDGMLKRLYGLSETSNSTVIVWGLISLLKDTGYYSRGYNVHKLSNILYATTESNVSSKLMFGDKLQVIGNKSLTLDLLPTSSVPSASTPAVPNSGRTGSRRFNSTLDSEPGTTSTPIRGSIEDPLAVEEVLSKWFTFTPEYVTKVQ